MLNLRQRRKATGSAGQGTGVASAPISTLPGSVAFLATVMSGNYRSQIRLQDLARAEREFVGRGHSFQVELTNLVDRTSGERGCAVVVKSPTTLVDLATSHWEEMRLEVLTLLHPPIAAHRNVVDLLAVGWESGLSEQVQPILVLPYASCGTLDVFSMNADATITWKHNIMLDVASGLKVLHSCGIVHGDLKSENVLLFWEGERPIAKLSDFGCSIVNPQQQDRLIGGSPPWNCPEWRDTLPAKALTLTDVYCLGLTIWRTALAEADPFRHLASFVDGDISPSNATIDILKNTPGDQFVAETKKSLSAAVDLSEFQVTLLGAVLDSCLRREPGERSLDDCLDCLKDLVSDEVYVTVLRPCHPQLLRLMNAPIEQLKQEKMTLGSTS
jgi:serine/threonine protein kinase